MPHFRKKPVVIEAEQFRVDDEWPKGVRQRCNIEAGGYFPVYHVPTNTSYFCSEEGPHVHTLEGSLRVSEGDWIITGVNGERYPCKPDIFALTYEPVDVGDPGPGRTAP